MLLLSILQACAPKSVAPVVAADVMAPPVLPSPDATQYATGPSSPADPLVAQVVQAGAFPWDESLSGGATGLALDETGAPSLERARWAAWRAGYPYAITQIVQGTVPAGEVPEDLVTTLRGLVGPGDDVGIIRARHTDVDMWIALVGHPAQRVGAVQRQLSPGDALSLSQADGLPWALVSPTGALRQGHTPDAPVLDEQGEWWLQLGDGARPVMEVPVYVGMAMPPAPLLTLPGDEVDGPAQAVELGLDLLAEVREAFELPALRLDGTLDTLAATPLQQVLEGTWDQQAGERRLQGAGYVGGPIHQVACQARTVALCVDQLLTSVPGRVGLLDPAVRVVGAQSQVETQGITMVINLASE